MSDPDTAATAPLGSDPEAPQAPTAEVERGTRTVSGLEVEVVTATPERIARPRPLVVTLGILARLDSFEEQRFRLLADLLRRPVIAIDTPGWMLRRGPLTASDRADLRTGGFDRMAQVMADALTDVHPHLAERRPSIAGYSLGASTGSALAAALAARGARLGGVTLIEPVAVRRQSLAELTLRNLTDVRHNRRYTAQTAALDWAVRSDGLPVPNTVNLAMLAWAISRGRIRDDLARLDPGVPVMLISGERSALSPTWAVRRLAAEIGDQGRAVDLHVVPGAHHALWNSLRHVSDVAALII